MRVIECWDKRAENKGEERDIRIANEDGMLIDWTRAVWMLVLGRVGRGFVALVGVVLRHSIGNICRLALGVPETIGIA